MQIVIDMPEQTYIHLYNGGSIGASLLIEDAIKNGTPLPKGHGDLIDRQELLKLPIDKANYPSNYVKYAPTIIEADGSEEDG